MLTSETLGLGIKLLFLSLTGLSGAASSVLDPCVDLITELLGSSGHCCGLCLASGIERKNCMDVLA